MLKIQLEVILLSRQENNQLPNFITYKYAGKIFWLLQPFSHKFAFLISLDGHGFFLFFIFS